MDHIRLFLAFLKIGFFSIGGGYAAMPMIQNQIVKVNQWMTVREFTDLITISQMTPGSISVNSATFVGLKIAGLSGAIVATLGTIVPSFIIVSILGFIYYRYKKITIVNGILEGLRPTVIALIASAGLSILITALFGDLGIAKGSFDYLNAFLFIGAIFVLRKFKWDATLVMVLCGFLNVVIYFVIRSF